MVGKSGKLNVGNYNGYYVYWRMVPNDGEKLKAKHRIIHRFALSKQKAGITKVKAFNTDAEPFIRTYIANNEKQLKDYIKASTKKRYQGIY